nr:uncharacterized protein LOC110383271 [Helicoverpa armigera]
MSNIARQAPVGPQVDQNAAAANRFSTASAVAVVITKLQRSSPTPASLHHYCDHILGNCLLIERTGKLCARTIYYEYRSYESYCHMDFINCREGDDIWQVVHMGACFELPKIKEYMHYVYHDDWFLDQYYILEDF